MIFPPIFRGKQMDLKYALPLFKMVILGCVITTVISIMYIIYYTNQLESKGYVSCKGIPIGYMPGMGKQYVTDLSLCGQ